MADTSGAPDRCDLRCGLDRGSQDAQHLPRADRLNVGYLQVLPPRSQLGADLVADLVQVVCVDIHFYCHRQWLILQRLADRCVIRCGI